MTARRWRSHGRARSSGAGRRCGRRVGALALRGGRWRGKDRRSQARRARTARRCGRSHSQPEAEARAGGSSPALRAAGPGRTKRRSHSHPEGARRRALNSGAAALAHSIRGWPARIGAETGALVAFTGAGWRPSSQRCARAAHGRFVAGADAVRPQPVRAMSPAEPARKRDAGGGAQAGATKTGVAIAAGFGNRYNAAAAAQ